MKTNTDSGTTRALLSWLQRLVRGLIGLLSLLVGLAFVATTPLLQVLSLGYLLVAGAHVAREGRLRGSLPGLALFEHLGAIAFGFWLLLWIPRLLGSLANDAYLIAPDRSTGPTLNLAAIVITVLLGLHAIAAIARGGRLHMMLIPRPRKQLAALRALASREGYRRARDYVWESLAALRLREVLRSGVLGFIAAVVWLLVPTTLLFAGSRWPPLAVLGWLLMAVVVFYLPFLQLRVAEQGRLGALMDIETVRRAHAGAPLAMAAALMLTVTFTLPLYLLKVELVPREAMWLPGILFVALMLPAKLACGWALHRGLAREAPSHRLLRIVGRLAVIPVLAGYAVVLYFTQYLSWYGSFSLYEQHAFLMPVPFLGF